MISKRNPLGPRGRLVAVPGQSDDPDKEKEDEEKRRRGARLRALRQAIGISHEQVVARSPQVAETLGGAPMYKPITRQVLSHVENGRMQLTVDGSRAILCRMFDINRDEFADYLDGKTTLDEVLAARAHRLGSAPRPARRSPRFRDAPDWPNLVRAARAIDPELTDATMEDVGESPFLHGPIEKVDAQLLAAVARAWQSFRGRTRPRGDG